MNLVGDLLVDMGRTLKDPKYFRQAIDTYELLRREYPGSRYRWEALFTIAQIYADELDDTEKAKAGFEEFLKQYPNHRLAEDAKAALEDLAKPKEKRAKAEPAKPAAKPARKPEVGAVEPRAESPSKAPAKGALPLVTAIRHWSTPDSTRVAIDLDTEVKYEAGRISDPERIFFDLHDTKLASELKGKSFDVIENGFLKKIRVAQYLPGRTRVVLEVDKVADYSAFLLPNPYRLIIDIRGAHPAAAKAGPAKSEDPTAKDKSSEAAKAEDVSKLDEPVVKATLEPTSKPTVASVQPRAAKPEATKTAKGKKKPAAEPTARAAKPASNGETSLIRALGLKIGKIVIDAGHGGHDTGTIGPNGFTEAELVLDVAMRLGKLLQNRLGAEVVFTREDDTFVPLETRTGIANRAQADLFLSIHANSSQDPKARGVETYYLNFTTAADALEVAARENAVSEKSIYELQDLVKKITLTEKVEESREFAASLQKELHNALARKSRGIRNRGVKKAPFIVLIGANMPSVLAEVSFLSNPTDEANLKKPVYRQRVAESLYKGIAQYADGLSGVKIASGEAAKAGQ
jgi:N-acetylmuramoyl-L-alanine amidase